MFSPLRTEARRLHSIAQGKTLHAAQSTFLPQKLYIGNESLNKQAIGSIGEHYSRPGSIIQCHGSTFRGQLPGLYSGVDTCQPHRWGCAPHTTSDSRNITPLPHPEVFKVARSTGHNLSGSSQPPFSHYAPLISRQCWHPVCCFSHGLLLPLPSPFASSDALGHRYCDSNRPRAVATTASSKGPFAVSSMTRQPGGYRRSSCNKLE